MKITPEDMHALYNTINAFMSKPAEFEQRDIRVALLLTDIYDRGYEAGQSDAMDKETYQTGTCPYTHAHTKHWCGYAGCRES